MHDADVPAIVMEALKARLAQAIADLPGPPEVRITSPWRAPEHGLFLHLHAITSGPPQLAKASLAKAPQAEAPLAEAPGAGDGRQQTGWMLRILMGAFAADELSLHRLMGRSTQALDHEPVLPPDLIAETARRLGLAADTSRPVGARILSDPITDHDMSTLWQRFAPMRYSLSSAWRILID